MLEICYWVNLVSVFMTGTAVLSSLAKHNIPSASFCFMAMVIAFMCMQFCDQELDAEKKR